MDEPEDRMTPRQRWEARIALAAMPAGAAMTLISGAAIVAIALLFLDTVAQQPQAAPWLLAWCLAAVTVAIHNLLKSIETMSAFEWRPMASVALLSAAIVLSYPGWWLHG